MLAIVLALGTVTLPAFAQESSAPAPVGPPVPAPTPGPIAGTSDDPVLARGQYLVTIGNCASCHTRPDGAPFTGGLAFTTPFGKIYSTNITPDDETGIGKWTAMDLRRAMHEGVAPGGRNLFPAFPYTSFTKVADEDVDAIYRYLRSLKPEHYTPPKNAMAFSQRWAMAIWDKLFFKPGRFVPDQSKSAEWNRGAYLVEGLGHCDACHTPRNIAMAEVKDRPFAGGAIQDEVAENKIRRWSAVNLTSAKDGLAAWSVNDLTSYLHTGFTARAGSFGPMDEVIVNSLKHATTEDVHAMATYLKSLPAQDSKAAAATADQAKAGEAVYKDRCENCHQSSGRGGFFNGPPVAGSAIAQSDDPASLINVILYGPQTSKDVSTGSWETMKPYRDVLTDEQIAAVATYLRGSWGNHGRPVTAAEVAKQR